MGARTERMLRITDKRNQAAIQRGLRHSYTWSATVRADKAGNQNEHGAINEGG